MIGEYDREAVIFLGQVCIFIETFKFRVVSGRNLPKFIFSLNKKVGYGIIWRLLMMLEYMIMNEVRVFQLTEIRTPEYTEC